MFWTRARRSKNRPLNRPGLVQLEDRTTPAALFVDLNFAFQDPAALLFNNGVPGQGADKLPAGGLTLGTDAFGTLRGAVEAANATAEADQIYIAAGPQFVNPNPNPTPGNEDFEGVTTGTLVISTPIDLIGQGSGLTQIEVTEDVDPASNGAGDTAAIVRADAGTVLNVSGLTIDGLSTFVNTITNDRYKIGSAIRYVGANGTLTDVTVQNVQYAGGASGGVGVAVIGPNALVSITDSDFVNNGRSGVAYFEVTGGKVNNSTFVGRGDGTNASYGIEILRSTGVSVTNNSIYGHTGNAGAVPISAGVTISDTLDGSTLAADAVLAGNDIFNNTAAVVVGSGTNGALSDASTATLRQNNLDGNGASIVTATTGIVDAKFNFYGSAAGPLAQNNNTPSGDNPGGEPTSEVGTQVDYQPFLTAAVDIGVGPTVTLVSPQPPTTGNGTSQTVTVAFSEPVTGFDAADVKVSGTGRGTATVSAPTSTDGGQTFTFTVSGLTEGTVTVEILAGKVQGQSGLDNSALPATLVATLDQTDPTGTVSAGGPDRTGTSGTLTAVITFSEAVTGLDKTEVTVSPGATVQSVTQTGPSSFTAVIGGFTGQGQISVGVVAGAVQDTVGNDNPAVDPVLIGTVADPVTGMFVMVNPNTTNNPTFVTTVTFSEAVTGFDKGDVMLVGTAKGIVQSVTTTDNKSFTVTVGGFTVDGTVIVSVDAGAATGTALGQPTAAVPAVTLGTLDTAAPTATISGPSGSATTAGSLVAVVTFSEPVTGLDVSDFMVAGTAGGKVQSVTASGSNSFTVVVGGFTGPGNVTLALNDDAAVDVAQNPSDPVAATAVGTVTAANPPAGPITATVVVPATTTGGDVVATIVFSSPVTLDQTKLSVGGTAGATTIRSVTASADGTTYTVTIAGPTQSGTVTLSAAAGAGTGTGANAGQLSTAATGTGNFVVAPAGAGGRGFAVGIGQAATTGGNGPFFLVDGNFNVSGGTVPFAASFTGGVRVASADVNGDGVLDIIAASGPGTAGEVRVYDGAAPSTLLFSFFPFEMNFTGGLFVAAGDVTGDGRADIVVTPDVGGGARVLIADGAASLAASKLVQAGNFFAFPDNLDFRGGARPAVGDLNGDGRADVIIGAGFGGGPRVSAFDGKTAGQVTPTRIANFFAFDGSDIQNLRNGVFVSAADLNADGKAEVFIGGGPGGGPRVRGLDGAALLGGTVTQVVNFFAGDPANRGGVRVSARDVDGDGAMELITAPGEGGGSRVTVYDGKAIRLAGSAGTPDVSRTFDLFGGFTNGAFVG